MIFSAVSMNISPVLIDIDRHADVIVACLDSTQFPYLLVALVPHKVKDGAVHAIRAWFLVRQRTVRSDIHSYCGRAYPLKQCIIWYTEAVYQYLTFCLAD